MKLIHNPMIVGKLQQQFGYSEALMTPIGIVELLCVVVYLIPRMFWSHGRRQRARCAPVPLRET
jgi:hypothetical protein